MLTPGIPLLSVVIKAVSHNLTSEDMPQKSNWLLVLVLSDAMWEQGLRSVEQRNDFFPKYSGDECWKPLPMNPSGRE